MSVRPDIRGSCHCGAVSFGLSSRSSQLVDCNCSICRRIRGLWALLPPADVELDFSDSTVAYAHGSKNLAFHSCAKCGCTTHWLPLKPQKGRTWMAVNLAMADPTEIADIPVRRFDGAESWEFLD